jgi:hypothetical protein
LPLNKKSLSLSCSDKLALYNLIGIQGKQLFKFIRPVYFDKIVVDRINKFEKLFNGDDIKNGLNLIIRLQKNTKMNEELIKRKIFHIIIDDKEKDISKQFKLN